MIELDAEAARVILERALKVTICEPFSGLVMIEDGRRTGACIFTHYTGRDVQFSCVSSGLLSIPHARFVARYVFCQLRCHRCTAITRTTNGRAIHALLQLGFVQEGVLREHYSNADGAVFGLLRSRQKIVNLGSSHKGDPHGRELITAAGA